VNTKAILAATIQRACQLAVAPPQGPTFVSIPIEFLLTETSDAGPPSALPSQPCADPQGVDELASMLVGAENPIIISEEAGRSAATVQKLVELAELLGCPVVETRSTTFLNFPRNHPLHGGFDPQEYLPEADAVFLLSTVLPWHSRSAGPRAGAKIAVLDPNPLHAELPFWSYPLDLCLVGELRASLASLVDRVESRPGDLGARNRRAESWRNRSQGRRQRWEEEALSLKNQQPIDTRWAVYELGRSLPANAAVVEETITHRAAVHRYLDRLAPGSFFAGCTGGLGTGLATALGVKVATPERTVVAVIGDGSFNYNPALAALGFAQEYAKPILIVLLNNSGYLSMKTGLRSYYPSGWAMRTETFIGTSITPSPDYAAIAGAFGGHGEKVEEPAAIGDALERGLEAVDRGRIALIDIRLDPK
jgi:acetolactate synthase-1/2/3 large subunit